MPRWTPESRERHRQRIQGWKPWEKSTGPRTAEGQQRSKMNAYKHGLRGEAIREIKVRLAALDIDIG